MLVGTYFSTMVTPIWGPLFRRFVVFDDVCFSFIAWEKCFSFWGFEREVRHVFGARVGLF